MNFKRCPICGRKYYSITAACMCCKFERDQHDAKQLNEREAERDKAEGKA